MNGEHQNAEAVGIIGGADGPTSIFIAGKKRALPLKLRIQNRIYRRRRRKTEKRIVAGTHTLEELIAYAIDTYGAAKANNKPGEHPADAQIYEINTGSNRFEIEIDPAWAVFGVSYSGNKKAMKHFGKIAKDLYRYYGVSEEDISKRSERYLYLLGVLSM